MEKPRKFYILGTVGSGKSFLGKKISKGLGIKHYDLDDIYWERKYDKKRTRKEMEGMLRNVCRRKSWIIEGVYGTWTKKVVGESEVIILLDFPLAVLVWRLIKRFFKNGEYKTRAGVDDLMTLIRYAYKYKKSDGSTYGFAWHEKLAKRSNTDFLVIKSNRELNGFLDSLK